MTLWRFYFQLIPGSIRSEQVIRFLMQLLQHISEDMIIVWDQLRCHRSKKVKEFIAGLDGRIDLEYLPAYAPELNPVEYLWGYWKKQELANLCPKDLSQLSYVARRSLRKLRRRKPLIQSFWRQAKLI